MKIGRTWLCVVFGFCSMGPTIVTPETPKLNLVHQWKQLEYQYESHRERQRDIANGAFAVGEITPIDVDVYYAPNSANNNIFLTVPRFREGIPASLGTVTNKDLNGNPQIKPYPDWSWHRNSRKCNRDRIVSVFRTKIDECDRLWVLDTGRIGEERICPPQILAFDLTTNTVVHRHEFPSSVLSPLALLVTPAVDVRDPGSGCRDTFVYVADVSGFTLIVYDVKRDKSWKIQDKTMYPYPSYGTFTIEGESFELMDGLLSLGLAPYVPGEDRVLFYHAMSSPTENWVYTSYLRNSSLFESDPSSSPQIFHTYTNKRSTQSAAEAIEKSGVMFFGLISNCQIACWNSRTAYGPANFDIVASSTTTLQFPSGIKVIKNRKGIQELWISSCRFQKIMTGTINPNETNFRIQAAKVDDLLFGTKCRGRSQNYQMPPSQNGGYGLYVNKE